MADHFRATIAIATPLFLGCLASFGIELLLKPRPLPPWRRPVSVVAHLGIWLLLYAALLLLLRRPWFDAATLLSLLYFVVLISNAKYRSLHEPFIYHDFSYFVDALRYPRLYLPFLGVRSALAALLVAGSAVTTGLVLEQPIAVPIAATDAAIIALAGAGLTLCGAGSRKGLFFEPARDLLRLGLPASLWSYGLAEHLPWRGEENSRLATVVRKPREQLPNLVVIQSESFFDPRSWVPEIVPDILREYDDLKRTAIGHGRLEVPVWGANTVRTEFAFLSGIANDQLGIHRFKPYRRLVHQGPATLAGYLKKLGYRTVCLHPYSAKFYGRDRAFPLMGFDEFIDISRFSSADYAGQYVGDAALAREVSRELALHDGTAAAPVFLFVITMENHGPLHLEQARPEDGERFYANRQPRGCNELTVFLRHLEQADRMLGMVRTQLDSMQRDGLLCVYGDHLPIMPEVYQRLGSPEGTVDYLVWSSNKQRQTGGEPCTRKVEQLAEVVIEELIGMQRNP